NGAGDDQPGGPTSPGNGNANDAGGAAIGDATVPTTDASNDGGPITNGDASDGGDAAPTPQIDLPQYVDPILGTGASGAVNAVGGGRGGSVFPGATVPFGMVQLSPDTPTGEPSGYGYQDTSITGFSLTHYSGAGCPNNGDLPILPVLS